MARVTGYHRGRRGHRKMYVRQGGLSDAVWNSPIIQEYITGIPYGYIGSFSRTVFTDKIVEDELRKLYYNTKAIANALISKPGRWLGDALSSKSERTEANIRIQTASIIAGYRGGRAAMEAGVGGQVKLIIR